MIHQELIKAKRECEAVKAQFEELNLRHSSLQHTLQLLDKQKASEAKVKILALVHVSSASAGDLNAIVRRVWRDVLS